MAPITHPTTIRLTGDDQTFLASLKIPGASTISDKLRALIDDKRLQLEAGSNFRSALTLANSLVGPLQESVKAAENEQQMHSQLVARMLDWTPELMATLLSESATREQGHSPEQLAALENGLANQALRLVDIVLQTYIARDTALYRPTSLATEKLTPLRRLSRQLEDNNNDQPK